MQKLPKIIAIFYHFLNSQYEHDKGKELRTAGYEATISPAPSGNILGGQL